MISRNTHPMGKCALRLIVRLSLSVAAGLVLGCPPAPAAGSLRRPLLGKSDLFVRRTAGERLPGWRSVIASLPGDLTPAWQRRIESVGGDIYRRLPLINAVAARVPARNLAGLAALPVRAAPVRRRRGQEDRRVHRPSAAGPTPPGSSTA